MLLFSTLFFSCSKDSDVVFETPKESGNTLLTTRTIGAQSISYGGGSFIIRDIPVKCSITNKHQHSTSLSCTPTEYSSNKGWYSVDMMDYFTTAWVTVQANKTNMQRTGKVGNTVFIQEGAPQSPNIEWDKIKLQYSILGPKWVRGEEHVSFTLTGPYLASTEVNIYWTIVPYYAIGGGTILTGNKTATITAFFHNPNNGGIVQVRVEPVKSPSLGFTIELVVAVN